MFFVTLHLKPLCILHLAFINNCKRNALYNLQITCLNALYFFQRCTTEILQLFVWSCNALQGIKNIFVACLFKCESLDRGQCTPLHMRVFNQAKPRPPCSPRWGRWRSRTAHSSETRPNEVWNAPSIFQMEWFTDLSRTVCLWSLTETQSGTFIFFKLMFTIMKIADDMHLEHSVHIRAWNNVIKWHKCD